MCYGVCHGVWYMVHDRMIFGIVCGKVYGMVWYSMIMWIVDIIIYTM